MMWVIVGFLLAALVVGAWCLITALWPQVGYRSVNDPAPNEVRIGCTTAAVLIGIVVICIVIEIIR
jgi:hypothetical protein